jgi:hypothetical protein
MAFGPPTVRDLALMQARLGQVWGPSPARKQALLRRGTDRSKKPDRNVSQVVTDTNLRKPEERHEVLRRLFRVVPSFLAGRLHLSGVRLGV